jgi:hypothetical protein
MRYRLDVILKAVEELKNLANDLEFGGDLELSKKISENVEKIQHHTVRLSVDIKE